MLQSRIFRFMAKYFEEIKFFSYLHYPHPSLHPIPSMALMEQFAFPLCQSKNTLVLERTIIYYFSATFYVWLFLCMNSNLWFILRVCSWSGHCKMQREEKLLESALEATLQRINDLKVSIRSLLTKLEYEHATLSWPSVLDSFALISGQVCSKHIWLTYWTTFISWII